MRTMYDAITPGNVPAGATLVAGYGDGYYRDVAGFRARFPGATVVEIAVFASDNLGTVLDVETGDASPSEAPGWVQRRRAAGVDPTVYCNTSTWPAVRAAFRAAGVPEPHYWVAQYDGDPTIPAGAVAKQWADRGPYDLSSVADYWPGVDSPQEVPVTQAEMQQLIGMLLGTKLGSSGPTVGEALQTGIIDGVWNYPVDNAQVSGLQAVPVKTQLWDAAASAGHAEGYLQDALAKVEALASSVAALTAKVDAIVAAGGPTAAAVQAAVQAAMQAEFAAAGKALEGAVAPPAPAPGGAA